MEYKTTPPCPRGDSCNLFTVGSSVSQEVAGKNLGHVVCKWKDGQINVKSLQFMLYSSFIALPSFVLNASHIFLSDTVDTEAWIEMNGLKWDKIEATQVILSARNITIYYSKETNEMEWLPRVEHNIVLIAIFVGGFVQCPEFIFVLLKSVVTYFVSQIDTNFPFGAVNASLKWKNRKVINKKMFACSTDNELKLSYK
ncbi:hypothetical protein EGR_10692 [Echinococcus granulosus]|uniref:Uncharacterized protein n=1 Tax=Echinococcus granulosus TaxID=6210 RepID=W6U7V4_ECHGR|nr:hypothetical protein EGR_10692 [Echinococcus granulosus]EUB54447.1 hypothetical protein EGR_10692 [Echinococcus granulosus]